MEKQVRGSIEHMKFFLQQTREQHLFWKGVEFLIFEDTNTPQYRIGYWANRGKGWRWGQFAVFFPPDLYRQVATYIESHPDGVPS
jgi:hypothetical protein